MRTRRPTTSAGPSYRVQSGKSKINRLASTINSHIENQCDLAGSQEFDGEFPEVPLYDDIAIGKEVEEKLPFSTFKPGAIKSTGCRSHLDHCKIEQITLRRLRYVIESNQGEWWLLFK